MFSVLGFLSWSAFELGHAEDNGTREIFSVVLYYIALYCYPFPSCNHYLQWDLSVGWQFVQIHSQNTGSKNKNPRMNTHLARFATWATHWFSFVFSGPLSLYHQLILHTRNTCLMLIIFTLCSVQFQVMSLQLLEQQLKSDQVGVNSSPEIGLIKLPTKTKHSVM